MGGFGDLGARELDPAIRWRSSGRSLESGASGILLYLGDVTPTELGTLVEEGEGGDETGVRWGWGVGGGGVVLEPETQALLSDGGGHPQELK